MNQVIQGVRMRCGFILIVLAGAASSAIAGIDFDRMIVFGDSLSDTGNVLQTTNNVRFVTRRPNTPYYDSGRWTNGASTNGQAALNLANSAYTGVWHEVLARQLGLVPAGPSLLGDGTNYAYGGATTANTPGDYTNNIGYQVNTQYLGGTPDFSSRHLYCIWGGGNDIRDAGNSIFWNEANVRAAATTAVTNLESYINAIAMAAPAGMSINVVWPNVPPLQSIPDFANANAAKRTALQLACQDFRSGEANAIARIEGAHPNVNLYQVDVYTYFTSLLAGTIPGVNLNAAAPILDFNSFSGLGFSPSRNAAVPNGSNPDDYVFWDKVHPTARVHHLIGRLAQQAIPAPPATLAMAIGGLAAFRRRRP